LTQANGYRAREIPVHTTTGHHFLRSLAPFQLTAGHPRVLVAPREACADDAVHQRELPYHPQMVTEDDVREVALSLPETAEKPYNRLPAFRVRSHLFIRIHELPDTLLVRCADLEERNELLKAGPGKFFITPHYDGYPAVLVRLSQVDLDEVTELVTESWRICAPSDCSPHTTRSTHPHRDRGRSSGSPTSPAAPDDRARIAA
jgi:hypothetical protein